MVRLLLEAGADPNKLDLCLRHAILHKNVDQVRTLLQHGSDANALVGRDNPLVLARLKGEREIIELLIKHGADANEADRITAEEADARARRAAAAAAAERERKALLENESARLERQRERLEHEKLGSWDSIGSLWILDKDFFAPSILDRDFNLVADESAHGDFIDEAIGDVASGYVRIQHCDIDQRSIAGCIKELWDFAIVNPSKRIVVNMSWGISAFDPGLESAFKDLTQYGIIFVAAAGNEGTWDCAYPAKYDAVIGVGSLGESDEWSPYSNRGPCVKVAVEVDAPSLLARNWRAALRESLPKTGTSLASAIVAAVIAKQLSRSGSSGPSSTNQDDILEWLESRQGRSTYVGGRAVLVVEPDFIGY